MRFGLCYLAPYVFERAGSPARTLPARLEQQKAIWPPNRGQNQGIKQDRFHWPPLCHDCAGPLNCCCRAADKPCASLNQQACKNGTPVAETKRKIPQKIASKFAKLNGKTAPVLRFKNWLRFGVRLRVCIFAFNSPIFLSSLPFASSERICDAEIFHRLDWNSATAARGRLRSGGAMLRDSKDLTRSARDNHVVLRNKF